MESWTNPATVATVRISTVDEGLDEVTFRLLSNPKFMILRFQICSFSDSVRVLGTGSIPGWGISPGGGNGNPLQYSCLEHPMNRGAWL